MQNSWTVQPLPSKSPPSNEDTLDTEAVFIVILSTLDICFCLALELYMLIPLIETSELTWILIMASIILAIPGWQILDSILFIYVCAAKNKDKYKRRFKAFKLYFTVSNIVHIILATVVFAVIVFMMVLGIMSKSTDTVLLTLIGVFGFVLVFAPYFTSIILLFAKYKASGEFGREKDFLEGMKFGECEMLPLVFRN
jgi:hypothetical protein